MEDQRYHPVQQPDEISLREKDDAMGSYLMMFASFAIGLPLPIINLIAAVIYYFTNKGKSRFVDFHITQSLLSQIPTTLLNAVLIGWIIRIFVFHYDLTDLFKGYAIMVVAANLVYLIFSIIGAAKAHKGRYYYFILFGPWAYHITHKVKATDPNSELNTPPRL